MTYSKEEKREYDKKYRELNREKRNEQNKKWYKKNKEQKSECSKKYYKLNKEKIGECNRKYNEENKEQIREQKREHRDERKSYCIEYLGGKCVKCGTTERLEFDHIDRTTKKYNITRKVDRTFDILKEELDKCQLLCYDCHKVKTKSERTK